MSFVLSFIALILLTPIFTLVALLIKLTSPGPIFFRQIRVGKNRREFKMIKFRTMKMNLAQNNLQVTASGDDRITFIGNFLRRSKIDELPELWNILIGDMSLVGPRPEVPRYTKHYKPEWENVFSVRPGITDPATLQFRNEESYLKGANNLEQAYIDVVLPIKVQLALEYVDKQSLWLDLKILFLTTWAITFGRFIHKPDSSIADLVAAKINEYNQQHSKDKS